MIWEILFYATCLFVYFAGAAFLAGVIDGKCVGVDPAWVPCALAAVLVWPASVPAYGLWRALLKVYRFGERVSGRL